MCVATHCMPSVWEGCFRGCIPGDCFLIYRYFHVTEGLIPDVMHDILEGVLPLEVKELLKYHINKKTFSLSELNAAMESFPDGGMDVSNKPTPISAATLASRDHLVKQTGKCTYLWSNLCYYCDRSYSDVVFSQTTSTIDWWKDWRGWSTLGELFVASIRGRLLFRTCCVWRLGCIFANDNQNPPWGIQEVIPILPPNTQNALHGTFTGYYVEVSVLCHLKWFYTIYIQGMGLW